MRERKYVKIKVDMFEDTKFKIIDSMAERDTIFYIWTRILALCGKINNDEGYLFVSKNIPYTIEILSLEFNRTVEQIKNAIDVFVSLNMLEIDDELNAYKVCNWGKHQGIRKSKAEALKEVKKDDVENAKEKIIKVKEDKKVELKEKKVEDFKQERKLELKENKESKNVEEKGRVEQSKITKDSKMEVLKFDDILDEACADKEVQHNKIKSKKSKRKRKNDEILVNDEDDDNSELYGFNVPKEKLGTVIKSFDFN